MPFEVTDSPVAPNPESARAVPLTRRERIAAERLAAGLAPRERAVQPVLVDGVPTSPDVAMPARAGAAVPTSPDVAMPVRDGASVPMSPDVAMPIRGADAVPTSPDVVVPAAAVRPTVSETAPVSPDVTPILPAAPRIPEADDRRVARPAVRRAAVRPDAVRRVRRVPAVRAVADAAPTRSRGSAFRRTASKVTGAAVLLVVAGLVVGTSVPAQAFYTPTQIQGLRDASTTKSQSLEVGATGATGDTGTNRDTYSVSEIAVQPAHTAGTFTNDPNGTIQWPFLTGVPISSQFGARNVEGCSFCSTFHEGVDFAPGEGTAIRSIAAGTVIKVKALDGGYGNDVWVQHDVDGKQFVSVYGHMKDDTFKVVEGQQIAVGTELGEVGSTGNSTGPHLHLEIHVNDVPVDPLAWLEANAN